MFKIDTSPSYAWPVTVPQLTEDGKAKDTDFAAYFKRLPQSQVDDLRERAVAGTITDQELANTVLVGWDRVQDEAGNPLPYSEENRRALLDVVPVRPSVIKAWFESLSGAPRKN
jgi:hypothetical protein